MKNYILFVISFLMLGQYANAFESGSLQRALDGRVAQCDHKIDLGELSYRMRLASIADQGDKKLLEMHVSYFKCSLTAKGFIYQPVNPDEAQMRMGLDGSSFTSRMVTSKSRLLVTSEADRVLAVKFLKPSAKMKFRLLLPKSSTYVFSVIGFMEYKFDKSQMNESFEVAGGQYILRF